MLEKVRPGVFFNIMNSLQGSCSRPRALLVLTGAGRIPRLKTEFIKSVNVRPGYNHKPRWPACSPCMQGLIDPLPVSHVHKPLLCVCAECAICRRLFRTRPDTSAQVSQFSTSPSPSAYAHPLAYFRSRGGLAVHRCSPEEESQLGAECSSGSGV